MPMWNHPRAWENKYPETGFPPIVDKLIDWLILPKWERDPKTQSEFARTHGCRPEEICKWKRDERIRKEIQRRADAYNLHPERIQEVMNALYRNAQGGDVKAISLYLQHAQQFLPTKRLVVEDKRVSDMTDEEMRQALVEVGIFESDA